jgi:hypothetical protein
MSLVQFKPNFDNTYEEIFQKVLVGKIICNTRFESVLKYGASVARVAYDISAVYVRSVTRGAASTIDALTDSTETLTINLEKEAVFFISDGEATQAGPLNPGEVIGGQVAIKVGADLDYQIFKQVLNAYQTFDSGDLTSLVSNGTPITLTATTVPQMVTRMPAKLRRFANQTITNMALVVDSYAASDIEQFLLGKQFSIVESVFQNGYAGPIATAAVYISENLTATANLTVAVTPTDGDTVTLNGVVFTFNTALSTFPGSVLISGSAANALTNLVALVNAPGTSTTYGNALTTVNANIINQTGHFSATSVSTLSTLTAGGRIMITSSFTSGSNVFSSNTIHAYYGKMGAIDLVIQDMKEVDMRETSDRRGTNVFSSYLAGVKTFQDGAKKFLDVRLAA